MKQITSGGVLYGHRAQGKLLQIGNSLQTTELALVGAVDRKQAMGQRIRHQTAENQRSGNGDKVWLSALIDSMEAVSHCEVRASRCDSRLLAAVRLQLARSVATDPDPEPELIQPRFIPGVSLRT